MFLNSSCLAEVFPFSGNILGMTVMAVPSRTAILINKKYNKI